MSGTTDERQQGLLGKFEVARIGDESGKHDECRYFVLDPKHDPIARIALGVYATEAQAEGYGPLAEGIHALLAETANPEESP